MSITRRSVIGLLAGGTAGALVTPLIWKTVDDISIWSQNWPWIPRIPNYGEMQYKPSLSKLDGSCIGVRVLMVDGKPAVAYGDPASPMGKGGISPLAACEVQMLYSPSRVKGPMKKTGPKAYAPISWDEAVAMLADKLKAAGGKAACVSGDETSSVNELFSGLLAKLGSKNFFFMPSDGVTAARTLKKMGGKGQLGYDFKGADIVLAVGADIFQSWGSYVAAGATYTASKMGGSNPGMQVVYCGPVKNGTAAVAGNWVPLKPGAEAAFLLALAGEVAKAKKAAVPADIEKALAQFAPKAVAEAIGVAPEQLAELAKKLVAADKPLVVAGGAGGGEAAVKAAMLLNGVLGRPLTNLPDAPTVVAGAMDKAAMIEGDLAAYLAKGEKPQVLMVYEANPAYALPQSDSKAPLLKEGAFVVSFSSFMDETAAMADLILPNSMSFERWDDAYCPYGCGKVMYASAAPVIKPLFDTKAGGDVILAVAKKLGITLGVDSTEALVKAKVKALGAEKPGMAMTAPAAPLAELAFKADGLAAPKAAGGDYPLAVAQVADMTVGSAKVAIPPHNTACVREDVLTGNKMFVRMNSATAAKYGAAKGKAVTLSSANGALSALVAIDEGVMDGVVAVPMGLGHTAWDEYSKGKGDNVNKVLTVATEAGTNASVWAGSMVKIG